MKEKAFEATATLLVMAPVERASPLKEWETQNKNGLVVLYGLVALAIEGIRSSQSRFRARTRTTYKAQTHTAMAVGKLEVSAHAMRTRPTYKVRARWMGEIGQARN